jgi:hypothetical protein
VCTIRRIKRPILTSAHYMGVPKTDGSGGASLTVSPPLRLVVRRMIVVLSRRT